MKLNLYMKFNAEGEIYFKSARVYGFFGEEVTSECPLCKKDNKVIFEPQKYYSTLSIESFNLCEHFDGFILVIDNKVEK